MRLQHTNLRDQAVIDYFLFCCLVEFGGKKTQFDGINYIFVTAIFFYHDFIFFLPLQYVQIIHTIQKSCVISYKVQTKKSNIIQL